MITISVIVPAYNCASTIKNTIASIFASGIADVEVIIVDDGSSDGTEFICDSLAEKYERVRCIHQKNAGVSNARNRGVREATGEYIWFFDSDDSVAQNSVRSLEELLNEYNPDLLIFGLEFDYYHKGKIYRRDQMLPPTEGMLQLEECVSMLYELFSSNSLSSLCTRMIRRSILTQMSPLLREEMFLYEDLEFSLRVLKQCSSIYCCRKAVYQYRQSEDGSNAGRRLMRISHLPNVVDQIENALLPFTDSKEILLSLYLVLVREKIGCATRKEIDTVCQDFRDWIDSHNLCNSISADEYAMLVYNGNTSKLLFRREKNNVRHSAANLLKRTIGDFRKWKIKR